MSNFRKIAIFMLLILVCMLLLVGCTEKKDMKVGDDVYVLDGVQQDFNNVFFDDFTNGVDYDSWYIGKQAWGAGGNGGVIPENVNYTDDGILVLTGNGLYYNTGDVSGVGSVKDGSLTGGALISKFITGPGRYQIKMKVLPRLGACTAFWTYAYDYDTKGNHEIDIELPGGKDHAGIFSFQNVLNTNYVTTENNESVDRPLKEVFDSDTYALNDGQWHTFGFDWYTNPKKVVYYIDDKVTAISSVSGTFVPYYAARLWLGVWFPNTSGFVGEAQFEKDYMYVDWVKYVPFLDQPYQEFEPAVGDNQVASIDEYPTTPVSTQNVNKIAGGDFEYLLKGDNLKSGWTTQKRWLTDEEFNAVRSQLTPIVQAEHPEFTEQEVADEVRKRIESIEDADDVANYCKSDRVLGKDGSCGASVSGIGQFRQTIDSIYYNFPFDLSIKAKGTGKVTVYFYDSIKELSCQTIELNSAEWQTYTQHFVAPKNTQKVIIIIDTNYESTLQFDDVEFRMAW